MENLATLLQRERLLLELLVFKLKELRHLLLEGDARFLGWAAEEVERAVEAVRLVELERAVLVQDISDASGDGDESQVLRRLAETAPEPWGVVLTEHRLALQALALEVADGLAEARRLAQAGTTAVEDLLNRVDQVVAEPALVTYGPEATTSRGAASPRYEMTL
jgi:hypothetical protein